jgi:hypothetical protein
MKKTSASTSKAFLLIGVLLFLFVLTLILVFFYNRSNQELLKTRASSTAERLRIETFSEFERFRRAFFNRVNALIQSPPEGVDVNLRNSIQENLGNFFNATGLGNFEIQCVGQGRPSPDNPSFQNSVCNLSANINDFPKIFRLQFRRYDSLDPSQAGQISGILQIMPQQLADYSLILRNSSQPVVFGSGVIDGNVAISFASPPANNNSNLPSNAVYFMNNEELRFTGNLKVGNAHKDNFFLYGKNPGGDSIAHPGQVIMGKGYSTSVDLDSLPIEETFEKLNKSCSDGQIECDHPQSDMANTLIRSQAPPEGWIISEARLKFGKVGGECQFQFEQTKFSLVSYDYEVIAGCDNSCPDGFKGTCSGPMLYCERVQTEIEQVWPTSGSSSKIPDKSVIAVDSSNIRIQSLDPNANLAETCDSSFTVLGTQGGNIQFDQSFIDSDLMSNPNENLKVAFALISNEASSATAARLANVTKLLNGNSIQEVYFENAAVPEEESFKIHATLIAAAHGEQNRALTVTLPHGVSDRGLGRLQIWGSEIANLPSQLRRMNNTNGNVMSGFSDVERRFIRNVAPGLNAETAVSLQASLSHVEYRSFDFRNLLEESGVDWQSPTP